MSWERRRQQLYYYRARREGGRVIKEYVGSGPAAVAAAKQDLARRAERAAGRQAEQERRQLDTILREQIAGVGDEADALVSAALLAAGFHRPQRKAWRKRRSRRIDDGEAAKEGRS
jgi:hypothetical protein